MGGPPMIAFSPGQAARVTGNSSRSKQERLRDSAFSAFSARGMFLLRTFQRSRNFLDLRFSDFKGQFREALLKTLHLRLGIANTLGSLAAVDEPFLVIDLFDGKQRSQMVCWA